MYIICKKEGTKCNVIAKEATLEEAKAKMLEVAQKNPDTFVITDYEQKDIDFIENGSYIIQEDNTIKEYKNTTIEKQDAGWLYSNTVKEKKNELVAEYFIIEIPFDMVADEMNKYNKKQNEEIVKETIEMQNDLNKKYKEKSNLALERIKNIYGSEKANTSEKTQQLLINLSSQLNKTDNKALLESICEIKQKEEHSIENLASIFYGIWLGMYDGKN
ncbi:MAG: hypothetical protein Edafosvirus6_11 [Edafosvirus sp.]|uniref:Uncharacterized protein n=1 Tax=Edafosvirus sp. TaxID=2487765 RepID=A0A3G4ZTE0_9VIRU|nr:MAG: hypothetical protein Edafosvirus6_11 [Edafosvirus sp.]